MRIIATVKLRNQPAADSRNERLILGLQMGWYGTA